LIQIKDFAQTSREHAGEIVLVFRADDGDRLRFQFKSISMCLGAPSSGPSNNTRARSLPLFCSNGSNASGLTFLA
jgi:hypothetical protein